jgi:hypothetical protein
MNMSYQEKRTIVSTVTGMLLLTAYCIYAYIKLKSGVVDGDDIRFWAVAILVFIGIGIVANIVIQILFHILLSVSVAVKKAVREEQYDNKEIDKIVNNEMVEDEMDRLIGLKSMRISFAFAGIGFLVGLVSLILNYSTAVMLNIIFFSFSIGSLLEGFTQLYYYRRGIYHV